MHQKKASTRNYNKRVENRELVWIPLADGRRLAARLVMPRDAASNPVPAILEYIPYRRRDGTRARDEQTMAWFAANGYIYVRVDISGTGDSDGLVEDEYVKREQDDAIEVIEWLSEQHWCSGSVGMIGISWGGFNGLQVAARQPKALKAVVAICATVDRYHDDVHYMGGCLLNDNLDWGSAFFSYGALPPDPDMAGEKNWRKLWKQRLEGLSLYPAIWMSHQRRDEFWRHGSVIENYKHIRTPVLTVSGWADGYTAAVFQLVENLDVCCKGLVGPWGHKYPHQGVPGPAIGFLQECKRWWDRWLKGVENGVEEEPDLRLYLQDSARPKPHFDHRDGRWLAIPKWPAQQIDTKTMHLGVGTLGHKPARRSAKSLLNICSPQTTGTSAGEWCAYALGKIAPELPVDQREDDAGSLVFDTDVLSKPLKLVGRPIVYLRVAADKPQAFVAVRLNDVRPDGSVSRISYGLLNLTHRRSHAKPAKLKPGEFYNVRVELNELGQIVPRGHRLRVSVSTSYWPIVWPSPESATLTVDAAGSKVELPVLTREAELDRVEFEPVAQASPLKMTVARLGSETRELVSDIETERTSYVARRDDGDYVIDDIGTRLSFIKEKVFSVERDDPLSAEGSVSFSAHYRRGTWDARIETDTRLRADAERFYLTGEIRAFDKGKKFFERQFKHCIKRDQV